MAKVCAPIKKGLKHGKYYRVYVTQVDKFGIESSKQEPVLIRVGDVTAPSVPNFHVNTGFGNNGYLKNTGLVDAGVTWSIPECDDLSYYNIYRWYTLPDYTEDKIYPADLASSAARTHMVEATQTTFTITGLANGSVCYVGIQAIDISGNPSDVSIIKLIPVDDTVPEQPTAPITITPGAWQLMVAVTCPYSTQISSVIFYRDNNIQLQPVPFESGMTVSLVDHLRPQDTLTHNYTYSYIDMNGNESPRSARSSTISAYSIDTTMLDQASLTVLLDAWNVVNIDALDAVRASAVEHAHNISDLAETLRTVQNSITNIYDKFTLVANQIELLSARADETDNTLNVHQTAIQQNADQVTLRAYSANVDNAVNQLDQALTSEVQLRDDQLNLLSSRLNGDGLAFSCISLLHDKLALKVDANGVKSAINMSPESIQLDGKNIHITGDTLFEKDCRIRGNLYAKDVMLIDDDGQVQWGASSMLHEILFSQQWHDEIYIGSPGGWQDYTASSYTLPGALDRAVNVFFEAKLNTERGTQYTYAWPVRVRIHNNDTGLNYYTNAITPVNGQATCNQTLIMKPGKYTAYFQVVKNGSVGYNVYHDKGKDGGYNEWIEITQCRMNDRQLTIST